MIDTLEFNVPKFIFDNTSMRGTAAALVATVFVAAASATIPSVVQRASVNWTDADWPAELGQYNKSLHDASYILAI